MNAPSTSVAVIVNPVTADAEASAAKEVLAARNIDVAWLETTEDDPGVGQARSAVERGCGVVIAVGGDGTVRACIEALSGTRVALGIVPAGTGNLLARNLGIPEDPQDALQVALGAGRKTIDVGRANGEAFAVMAGAGVDAAIMRDTSREAKNTFGVLAYITTALGHITDERRRVVATVDDGPVFAGPAATVLAANFSKLQGGIDLAPDSDPSDGRLDFVAVRGASLWDWLRTGIAVLRKSKAPQSISRWSGTSANLQFGKATPYELDGDERPAVTNISISVEPAALTVCVPEEEK